MVPDAPLSFRPVYKAVVWGGRRLERWRPELPDGRIGESWDLADHDGGMSLVEDGPLAGSPLRDLVARFGEALVGRGFRGGSFPLMVKLIDARERLSVQVHPDDALARSLGVGKNGKTECWLVLEDGGEIFLGTRPGVDRATFERALAAGELQATLEPFDPRAGDCFFLPARTVHALGAGCLVYELQQTSDVTFRVFDWNRMGTDGKPRPLHVREALDTIDFSRSEPEKVRREDWGDEREGRVARRTRVTCDHFRLEEYRVPGGALPVPLGETCAVVTCLAGAGEVVTVGGSAELVEGKTVLVPAAARRFEVRAGTPLQLLVATPRFS
jgi:mannose-6-phosphate isomerase